MVLGDWSEVVLIHMPESVGLWKLNTGRLDHISRRLDDDFISSKLVDMISRSRVSASMYSTVGISEPKEWQSVSHHFELLSQLPRGRIIRIHGWSYMARHRRDICYHDSAATLRYRQAMPKGFGHTMFCLSAPCVMICNLRGNGLRSRATLELAQRGISIQ